MESEEVALLRSISKKLEKKKLWSTRDLFYAIPILLLILGYVYAPWSSTKEELTKIDKHISAVELKIEVHKDFNEYITKVDNDRIISLERLSYRMFPDEIMYLRNPDIPPYKKTIESFTDIYEPWSYMNCIVKAVQKKEKDE